MDASIGTARVSQVVAEIVLAPLDGMARISQVVVEVVYAYPKFSADAVIRKERTGTRTADAVIA